MTTDPCPVPHPSVPNVRDLAGEVATLRRHIDVLVIALARAHGIPETTVRHNMGLPAGNPWAARRANVADSAPVSGSDGLAPVIGLHGHPRPETPAEMDYAI